MRMKVIVVASVCALVGGASAMLAAPGQGTKQPGQMTEAHVWVQNRGKSEAVPIDLREVNLDTPLRVQIINGEPAFGAANPALVRVVRPLWEYKSITLKPDEAVMPGPRLNAEGAAGWETTGIVSTKAEGTTLLLKRQR